MAYFSRAYVALSSTPSPEEYEKAPPPPYSTAPPPSAPVMPSSDNSIRKQIARELDTMNPRYHHCYQCMVHQRTSSSKAVKPSKYPALVERFYRCPVENVQLCNQCYHPSVVCPICLQGPHTHTQEDKQPSKSTIQVK